MDNARIHHATKAFQKLGLPTIKELMLSKNIEPLYLVSYSPQLNPVELCFNFLVGFVEGKQPRTHEQLKSIIEEGIEKLQAKDMRK